MLVLSRTRDEKIIFDFTKATDEDIAKLRSGEETIVITCVDLRGDKCRIGSDGPKSVHIDREEVFKARRKSEAA